ncbi:MAG: polysaccharide deacetylase family protein [Lachnospiraceae bacterium]|nr:polysaccharide deacetylase family protein [Lachnospiraceae bacterium]
MTRRELLARRAHKKKLIKKRRMMMGGGAVALVVAVALVLWFATSPLRAQTGSKPQENTGVMTAEADVSGETESGAVSGAETVTGESVSYQNADTGDVGWNLDDRGWWYKTEDGQKMIGGWKTIDGEEFYFDSDGYALTGWQHLPDGRYVCFGETGIYQPDAEAKYVALTFDDGPSWDTDRILDTLKAYDAKATFFVVGEMAEVDNTCRNALKRTKAEGMEIGSHTWNHTILKGSDAETIATVMQQNDDYLVSMIGEKPSLMRPTGGGIDDTVRAVIDRPMILWDVDTLDWSTLDPQSTFETAISEVKDGSIILMHDIYVQTADAVEMIVPELARQGYHMVTVSELAAIKGVTLQPGQSYSCFTGQPS